jgi:tetratricopeptide (TPR) repeat protein
VSLSAQEFELMDKGWHHLQDNQFDSAIYYFDESLKQFPNEHVALKLRGIAYASSGNCRRAVIDLTEALKYRVDSIETLSVRVKCYFQMGRMDLTVADATTLLTIGRPDYKGSFRTFSRSDYKRSAALYFRALALYQMKQYDPARRDIDDLLKIDSLSESILLIKAQIQLAKKDPQGALITAAKILAYNPDNAAGHIVRGFAWVHLDNRKEVAKEARLAMETANQDAGTMARAALLFTFVFENEMAMAVAQRAIELDPTIGLAYASLGVAQCALQKYPEAIKTLTKAISTDPTIAVSYLRRGQSYYMLKDYAPAHRDLYKAQQLDPSQPETYMFIGYVFKAMKNQSEACRYWKIAFEKGGTDIGEEIKIYCK